MDSTAPVIVVGAGLSGLCAAVHLHRANQPVLVLEASDAVGGRIRTDRVAGFTLDRGFQVLLSAYPQVQSFLDLPALDLRPFTPGAMSYFEGQLHPVRDPFRQPAAIWGALCSPVGSLKDKIRVGLLRLACLAAGQTLLQRYNTWKTQGTDNASLSDVQSTRTYLQHLGFSDAMMTRFFEPFLAGVFLDPALSLPAEYFRFLFRCFAVGEVALPAQGMQAIPEQLASRLPEGCLRLKTPVREISARQVTLDNGQVFAAKAVILATDAPAAAKLLRLPETEALPGFGSTRCLYFSAPESPIAEPILVLNGEGRSAGPINTLCVPSLVVPGYAPVGQQLVSVSVTGEAVGQPEEACVAAVLAQAGRWFGASVEGWALLKSYTVPFALPHAGWAKVLQARAQAVDVTACGDYSPGLPFSPSIQGAMLSGQYAAVSVLGAFNR